MLFDLSTNHTEINTDCSAMQFALLAACQPDKAALLTPLHSACMTYQLWQAASRKSVCAGQRLWLPVALLRNQRSAGHSNTDMRCACWAVAAAFMATNTAWLGMLSGSSNM
jgi:hypothetical protein